MKTLEQIKDEVAYGIMNDSPRTQRNAPKDWHGFMVWRMADRGEVERAMEEVAKRYAKETLKEADKTKTEKL
jgi:hypothetical protein